MAFDLVRYICHPQNLVCLPQLSDYDIWHINQFCLIRIPSETPDCLYLQVHHLHQSVV